MYHDTYGFKVAETPSAMPEPRVTPLSLLSALLIVAALPVLSLALLLNFFWHDLRVLVQGAKICIRTYAQEFARR